MIRAVVSRAVLVLLCAFVCFPFPASSQQKSAVSAPDADEYAIYSLIVRTQFAHRGLTKIVVREHSGIDQALTDQMLDERRFGRYVGKMLPGIHADTIADFKAKSKKADQLEGGFSLKVPCILVADEEINAIFRSSADGWYIFYKKYPGAQGILTFSRVGFDRQRNEALVYFGNQRQWLDGAGYLVLLAKKDDTWVILEQTMIWIS